EEDPRPLPWGTPPLIITFRPPPTPFPPGGRLHAMTAAKKKVAALVTVYTRWSHADVIVGKVLEGYHHDGKAGPDLQVVSMYVDQFPEGDYPKGDWSKHLARKHGFTVYPSIEKALTCGGRTLAVD